MKTNAKCQTQFDCLKNTYQKQKQTKDFSLAKQPTHLSVEESQEQKYRILQQKQAVPRRRTKANNWQ